MAERPPRITLVSGPAASGKSRWAEHLSEKSGLAVVVLATGPDLPDDLSWQERLERHRRRRPATWRTLEVGGDLCRALRERKGDELALVDSLGTWVAAHLESSSKQWEVEMLNLVQTLLGASCRVVMVSEETGWGVVPVTAAGGTFRDRLGEVQQRLAPHLEAAWLVIQGRALDLGRLAEPVHRP